MTPEISRVSGDTEAKLRFVRDTLNQFNTVEDVAIFSTAMLHSIIAHILAEFVSTRVEPKRAWNSSPFELDAG